MAVKKELAFITLFAEVLSMMLPDSAFDLLVVESCVPTPALLYDVVFTAQNRIMNKNPLEKEFSRSKKIKNSEIVRHLLLWGRIGEENFYNAEAECRVLQAWAWTSMLLLRYHLNDAHDRQ